MKQYVLFMLVSMIAPVYASQKALVHAENSQSWSCSTPVSPRYGNREPGSRQSPDDMLETPGYTIQYDSDEETSAEGSRIISIQSAVNMAESIVLFQPMKAHINDEFFMALMCENIEGIRRLLKHNIYDAALGDENGMTPLMWAAKYGKVEVVKFLLTRGVDQKALDDKGHTVIDHASEHPDVIAAVEEHNQRASQSTEPYEEKSCETTATLS